MKMFLQICVRFAVLVIKSYTIITIEGEGSIMDFKDSIYWKIYGDVWNYHKKFADIQESDEYWDDVVETAGEVYRKYEGKPEHEFAKSLILNVVDELEGIYRRNRNKQK